MLMVIKTQDSASVSGSESGLTSASVVSTKFCTKKIDNCLLCRSDSCRICDVFDGAYASGKACKKCENQAKDCQFSMSCGKCQICNEGFTRCTNSCKKNIENCAIGDACTQKCTVCNTEFYLLDGKCTPVEKTVENCALYDKKDHCKACKSTHSLVNESDSQKCNEKPVTTSAAPTAAAVEIPKIENCFVYGGRRHSCESCVSNLFDTFFYFDIMSPYKKTENALTEKAIAETNTTVATFLSMSSFGALVSRNAICVDKKVENCLVVKEGGSFECTICATNYHLVAGACVRFEQAQLFGCEVYIADASLTSYNGYDGVRCGTCKNGYWKNSSNECVKYTLIDGCTKYSADYKTCETCSNVSGFKKDNTTCKKITNYTKVENCTEYHETGTDEGKCKTCSSSTMHKLLNNKCNLIANCSVIAEADGVFTCTTCMEGHKISEDKKSCNPLDAALNCLVNKDQTSDECTTCKEGYFPDKNDSFKCKNVRDSLNYVSNCVKGQQDWKCAEGKPYHLNSQKIHECLPEVADCLFYDNANKNKCLICDNGKIPDNTTGACTGTPTAIADCKIYKGDGTTCYQCNSGKFLTGGTCVDSNAAHADKKLCKHNPLTGIMNARFTGISNDNNTYTQANHCSECLYSSFVAESSTSENCIPKLADNSSKPFEDATCSSSQIRVQFHKAGTAIRTCRNLTDIVSADPTLYTSDPNCAFYLHSKNALDDFLTASITNAASTVCMICKSGFEVGTTGKCTAITNAVADASKFGGVGSCNTGFTKALDGLSCITSVANCKVLDPNTNAQCIECDSGYYGTFVHTGISETTALDLLLGVGDQAAPATLNLDRQYYDANNVQVLNYTMFYLGPKYTFTACGNAALKKVNNLLAAAGTGDITNVSGVLAVETSSATIPSICRAGYHLSMDTASPNEWSCQPLTGSVINHNPNVFLDSAVSKGCQSGYSLSYRVGPILGPFCIKLSSTTAWNATTAPYDQKFVTPITNCLVHMLKATGNSLGEATPGTAADTDRTCLLCSSGYGSACAAAVAADFSLPCKGFTGDKCTSCESSFTVVNNICMRDTNVLFTAKNITTLKTEMKCASFNMNGSNPAQTTTYTPLTDATKITCATCQSGYIMNYENKHCVSQNDFNLSNCLNTENEVGCLNCNTGLMVFAKDIAHEFCVAKPDDAKFDPAFDSNCTKYKYLASKKYECISCGDGFTLLSKKCEANLPNCSVLNTKDKCSTCADGYFKESDKCVKGNIYKCKTYNKQYECGKCEDGFDLYGNSTYVACVDTAPIKASFKNCETVESVINTSNNYYCSCKSGNIPLNTSTVNDSIYLPNYVDQCVEYQSPNLTQCNRCMSEKVNGVWSNAKSIVKNNVCVERVAKEKIANCDIYTNNKVECSVCKKGYYVTLDKKCQKNPVGKQDCRYPRGTEDCALCYFNFFWNSDKECKSVAADKKIDNCYLYDSDSKCTVCKRQFLVNDKGECEALSDKTFLDENNTCMFDYEKGYPDKKCTCMSNMYYFNETEKKCKSMENCMVINSDGSCKQCRAKFYYDATSKSCKDDITEIENCVYYNAKATCSLCAVEYVLNANKCELVAGSDRVLNCSKYVSGPKCILCNPGFMTNGADCTEKLSETMYYSSSADKEKALICKTKYSMDEDRKCIANGSTSSTTSAFIYKALMCMIALLVLRN